jgi:anti-sigma B factor antagonist
MEITIQDHDRVSVVTVTGRLDAATAPDLETALSQLVDRNRNNIVLDLKEVDFISSIGLRAIIFTYKSVKRADGDLRLASPSPAVEMVLKTLGLTPMFSIYPSSKEAIASF